MEHHVTLVLGLVGLLGIGAQWLAWRVNLPAIVLLLAFGLLAGPVFGWIRPGRDLGDMLDPLVRVGVAVILFEGGLNLHFHELRQAGAGIARLVTLGVLVSFPLGSLAAHHVGGLSWPVALVFGAIVVVTGPTVIIPLLRQARLRRRPASYLKWEGIVNDPVGALLAVVVFEYLVFAGDDALSQIAARLAGGLFAAGLLGVGWGLVLGTLYRRGWVPEYLKGPGALASAILVYVLGNQVLGESGLLAATLLGVTLGNMELPGIDEMRRFEEYMGLILVSGVFILLTANLETEVLRRLDWRSVALLGALIFAVRPVSIFLSTLGAGMTLQERALLGWIAPRGVVAAAVAGIFGPELEARGFDGAELLLPLVFALVLVTVLAHGLSMGWVSRRLGLSAATTNGVLIVGASPWTVGLAQALGEKEVPAMIVDSSWHRLRAARLAGVKVFYGEILSEASEQQLEFNDYGNLLAATDNDAYNALVCSRFGSEMGRNRTFQLPDASTEEPDPKRLPRAVRGVIVPAADAWFEELVSKWYSGWRFRQTRLTEEFREEDWQATLSDGGLPVLVLKADGLVWFNSPEQPVKPGPNDTVIWFGPQPAKAQSAP